LSGAGPDHERVPAAMKLKFKLEKLDAVLRRREQRLCRALIANI
jgi:hypothetical protein